MFRPVAMSQSSALGNVATARLHQPTVAHGWGSNTSGTRARFIPGPARAMMRDCRGVGGPYTRMPAFHGMRKKGRQRRRRALAAAA